MSKLTRRDLLKSTLGATALGALGGGCARNSGQPLAEAQYTESGPPNILLIVSDDHRADAMGCAGHAIVQTPHLDSLAREGVRFTNNFAATPLCVSSRASILTGTYTGTHRIEVFQQPLTPELRKLAYHRILREAGYRTGFIGKWGLGGYAPDQGLDEVSTEFDYWGGWYDPDYYLMRSADGYQVQHLCELMAFRAVKFLLDEGRPGQPFCLSLDFKAPHAGKDEGNDLQPDPELASLYEEQRMERPRAADPKHFAALPGFIRESELRRRWERRLGTEERFQRTAKDYYRLITGMDRAIGLVLSALRRTGQAENTVVVYTSDNGWLLGEHGLGSKGLMYEESIRTPLLVRDPRLPAALRGRTVEPMTLNVDVAPTLLDWAGTATPAGMQGVSVRPLVEGAPVAWRKDWFYEHRFPQAGFPKSEGVRTETMKYVRYLETDPFYEQLFDLKRDPVEMNNLVDDPAYRDELERMRGRWAELRRQWVRDV